MFSRLHRSSGNRRRRKQEGSAGLMDGKRPGQLRLEHEAQQPKPYQQPAISPSAPCLACWLSGVTVELGHDMDQESIKWKAFQASIDSDALASGRNTRMLAEKEEYRKTLVDSYILPFALSRRVSDVGD